MKKAFTFFSLIVLLAFTYNSNAQNFPFKAKLLANSPSIISTPTTKKDARYKIIVEGTYSMWPQYSDCHGVDAVYVYDVPQVEIDAYRWPDDTLNIPFVGKIPFYTLPHWVGDDKNFQVPPKELGLPLIKEMSMSKNVGFRIDNAALPNSGINHVNHRYEIEKIGTGSPFEFQILDSAYNVLSEKTLARYEDNCGFLNITVTEIIEGTDITICDIKPICDPKGNYIGLNLLASIFQIDTSKVSNKKNLLKEISMNQLGIVENGKFKCGIDSIVCKGNSSGSKAVGILVDRSGSMQSGISEKDGTERMTASKSAIKKFISQLNPKDSAYIMSFASDITLDQEWTGDKDKLNLAIDYLIPAGSTQFYGATLKSLEKIKTSQSPNRAMIILSDGGNTTPPNWNESMLKNFQDANIPIYIVALGLSSTDVDVEGRSKMQLISNASKGKIYDVYNSNKLDSVWVQIGNEFTGDACCNVYFKIDECKKGEKRFIRLIYAPSDTTIISQVVNFECKDCSDTLTSVNYNDDVKTSFMNLTPNPATDNTVVKFIAPEIGNVRIELLDVNSKAVYEKNYKIDELTSYFENIPTNGLAQGAYMVRITLNGKSITQKLIVVR
ncbi:MAG: VWA domain-containing protein [Candidatus Kapabacteria bacterium]|nr:VWA domain-containing protein [Candidatus Kapabacteria bacterium]